MIGEERDVYHQQKNFRHGAIKLSKVDVSNKLKDDKNFRNGIKDGER